jgi:hypothetical protein
VTFHWVICITSSGKYFVYASGVKDSFRPKVELFGGGRSQTLLYITVESVRAESLGELTQQNGATAFRASFLFAFPQAFRPAFLFAFPQAFRPAFLFAFPQAFRAAFLFAFQQAFPASCLSIGFHILPAFFSGFGNHAR